MRVGLGDDNSDLNALLSTQIANQQLNEDMAIGPLVYGGSTNQTGTPLLLGSSTVSQAANQLSSNSGLVVALCAILGLFVAVGKK